MRSYIVICTFIGVFGLTGCSDDIKSSIVVNQTESKHDLEKIHIDTKKRDSFEDKENQNSALSANKGVKKIKPLTAEELRSANQ